MKGLRALVNGRTLFPLVVLTTLFFFDEWDTAAFNVLAPNIQQSFHLSDHAFGLLVVANLSVVLLLAIPVGYYGDRLNRTAMVVGGAVVAGVFSLLTGVAGGVLALSLIRLGNGVGRLVNDPVHSSMLADYYEPETRPAVYAIHRNGERLAQVFGPAVAGVVAALAGWRAAFMVLIVPIVLTAVVATKLREPTRGATDDPDAAAVAEREPPVPFAEARRTLFAVPTLKRQFGAFFFIGAGLIPLAFLSPIFLERAFHVSELGRGMVVALNGAAAFGGIVFSGRLTPRWAAKDAGEPMRWAGLSLVGVGVGVALTAYAPTLWLAVVLAAVTSFVGGIFTPPYVTVQAAVSPARVRSLSFAFGALFLLAGVWVLYLILPVAGIADHHGIRLGLAATAPYWVIGGLIMAACKRFVAADIAAASGSLAAMVHVRADRRHDAATDVLLSTHGLTAGYDGVQVLFGVDIEVHRGECVALLGTNGAGKSTVLKAITGLLDPTGGLIVYDGRDVTHADPVQAASLGIAQMPGGKGIFPTLTVAEHFAVAGWRVEDKADLERGIAEVYAMFPRIEERKGQLAGNLSGGEQQMLALGMAFVTRPQLLLIDELSLGLAPTVVEQLANIVRQIHATGTTIVIVEQSVNVALTLADRAYFMEKGEVRFHGPTKELLERDDIVRSVFLTGAAPEPAPRKRVAKATTKAAARATVAERAEPPVEPVEPLLWTQDVCVRFGGIRALTDVSISVAPGEILGLIGPNGAGKTTYFDVLSGFVTPSSGSVHLGGFDVTRLSPDARARMGLGRSFQDARIFPSLTVAENLAMGLERHLEVRDHVAAALGLPAVRAQEEEVAYSVDDLVQLMNLGAFRDKFVADLSTGSRRIVDLAMALAHDPALLILDEPSSGIAQAECEAMVPLLRGIRDETGCALLVIEHDMPLISNVSDRMLALVQGQVIAGGTPAQVLADPQVIASYLGTDPAAIRRSTGALASDADGKPAPRKRAPRKKVSA